MKSTVILNLDEFAIQFIQDNTNEKLITQLYNHIYEKSYYYIKSRLVSQTGYDEAVCVITQVILRLQKDGHKWDSRKGSFNSWINSTIRFEISNYIQKYYRNRKRITYYSTSSSNSDDYDAGNAIFNTLESNCLEIQSYNDLKELLINKINEIPIKYKRELLYDFFIYEYKYIELQNKYALPNISRVKNIIRAFRKTNEKYFKEIQAGMGLSY